MTLASTRRKVSRRAIRLVPCLRNLLPAPAIRIAKFPRRHPELFVPVGPRPEGTGLVSQLCRLATLESPAFRGWLERLHDVWHMHRKNWEHAYICQALHERSLLQPGRRGLGFAVGTEKLPALFAALGCRITAPPKTTATTAGPATASGRAPSRLSTRRASARPTSSATGWSFAPST